MAALPAKAKAISGKLYAFAPNPLQIDKLGVTFNAPAEALLQITPSGGAPASWPIGLDGVYRLSTGKYNLPQGLRGAWVDNETFVCEYDNIANNDHIFLRLHFTGDRLVIESQETAHELSNRFEGKVQNP